MSLQAHANMCSAFLSVTSASFNQNFNEIQAVLAAGMQRQQLLDAQITYGPLSLGAGRSKLTLEVVGGKIVNLNIDTNVRMAGVDFGKMQNKINISDFSAGRPLTFKMEGAEHSALIITPGSGFNSRGGRVSIKTWTGRLDSQRRPIYSEPSLLYISANSQGQFSLYKSPATNTPVAQITQARNKVTGLRINMRGNAFNTSSLYAGNYRITTQGG